MMIYKSMIAFSLIFTSANAYAGAPPILVMSDLALMGLSFVLVGVMTRFIAKKRK